MIMVFMLNQSLYLVKGNTLNFKSRDYNSNNNDIRDILTMRPDGFVGIGNSNPGYPLQIHT